MQVYSCLKNIHDMQVTTKRWIKFFIYFKMKSPEKNIVKICYSYGLRPAFWHVALEHLRGALHMYVS